MKNKFSDMLTPTLAKLTRANFFALAWDLSFASGIEEIASRATIIPNHIMYSKWLGYWSQLAISWEKMEIKTTKKEEVVSNEYSVFE